MGRGVPFPHAPHPFPGTLLSGEVQGHAPSLTKGKRNVFSPYTLSIEIICKNHINTPQDILPLEKAAYKATAQRRPARTKRKNRIFFRETPGRMA